MANDQPLILLDVDGVLRPAFRCHPPYCHCHPGWLRRTVYPDGGVRIIINPQHRRWLLDLANQTGAELAWATTWGDQANQWISPELGLPQLPVAVPARGWPQHMTVVQWKASQVAAWAGERPFVWFDDEEGTGPELERLGAGPHHVVWVNEHFGLTEYHIAAARGWLTENYPRG